MINVTDSAKEHLKDILQTHCDDPEFGLRLTAKAPGELGLVLDREMEDDEVVEYEGSKVLLVEEELADLLDEHIIDVRDTDDGPKLVISKG